MASSYYQNKKIWLTGASSGIGEALCKTLSTYGAFLIISSRNQESLEKLRKSLAYPDKCKIYPVDLSDSENVEAVGSEVLKKEGPIDILINNAGISQRDYAINTTEEVDRQLMEVNYFANIAFAKKILPSMLERGSGHFVIMSSVTGHLGTPMRSGYAASKHALHGFYDSLRAETEANGIKTTIICPGYIQTNISINALTGDGSPQNKMDENTDKGMTPAHLALKALNGVAQGKREIYIGGKEILGIYIKRYMPWLYYRIIRNYKKP